MAGFDKVVWAGWIEGEFRGQSFIFPIQQLITKLSEMKAPRWLSDGTVPHVSRPINYILTGFPVRDATTGPSTLAPSSVADDGGFKQLQTALWQYQAFHYAIVWGSVLTSYCLAYTKALNGKQGLGIMGAVWHNKVVIMIMPAMILSGLLQLLC